MQAEEADLVDSSQSDMDELELDTEGLKFWTIWLSSGILMTILFFIIAYNVVDPKVKRHIEQSVRSISPSTPTQLSAFVININENLYNSDIVRGWKDLLQSWATYSPCNAFSKPINWECSNVDLILYAARNDLSGIKEDLKDYWLMSTERNRMCFRDFYILDVKNTSFHGQVDYYFSIDFVSTPTTSNWLNKIVKILDKHFGIDFIGFYNGVGIYRSKAFPILQKPHLESKSSMKLIRMTSDDRSTLFFNPHD
jgi:hypothetical protein